MIHEYEEIIMFRRWIDRNREELRKRFPKIESFFTRRGVFDYSTSTFAIGTAHEFILISVVSFCSVWTGEYQWWFGVAVNNQYSGFSPAPKPKAPWEYAACRAIARASTTHPAQHPQPPR